jgi:hypothetical protein
VTDESPFDLLKDAASAQVNIRDGFQQSMDEILSQVDRIRQNLRRRRT